MGRLVSKLSRLAVCFTLVGSATATYAGELKWTHYGVRPLAMGNAYVAVADDFNALFYNPAGLARLKSWSGELLNPSLAISSNTVGAASSIGELMTSSGGSSSTEDGVLRILQDNTGKPQYFNITETPHLIFPGFGIGIGLSGGASLVVHRDISADVDTGIRMIAPIAFAKNFFEDRLSVGASVKFVGRGGVNHTFGINDISAFTNKSGDNSGSGAKLSDFVEGGYGVGGDVGILFTPIKTMQPTLGLSVTDLGGTAFKKADVLGQALGTPATTLPSVNAGVSLRPWQLGSMYLLTSADAHAVNQPLHYSKKFNLGAEWGWGSVLKVQTGLHQGSLSGGIQLDVFLLTLRFVTYTEQLGTIAGQDANLQDRRYALQLKLLI